MKLNDLSLLLAKEADKPFKLLLPGSGEVPQPFRVTEVGYVKKQFLDGTEHYHQSNTVQLQACDVEDHQRRQITGSLAQIVTRAVRGFLPHDAGEFPVEVEYEHLELTQFRIQNYEVNDDEVVLHLTAKHCDCVAKDRPGGKPA